MCIRDRSPSGPKRSPDCGCNDGDWIGNVGEPKDLFHYETISVAATSNDKYGWSDDEYCQQNWQASTPKYSYAVFPINSWPDVRPIKTNLYPQRMIAAVFRVNVKTRPRINWENYVPPFNPSPPQLIQVHVNTGWMRRWQRTISDTFDCTNKV